MALDVVCLVVPFATGSAALKATVKTANAIDNVLDATKAVNRADDVVDVIRAADKVDNAIDAGKAVGKIAGKSDEVAEIAVKVIKNSDTVTKSSMKYGQQMHKAYRLEDVDKIVKFKERVLKSGKRVDFIDYSTRTVYELKPNNIRSIKQGRKQLIGYIDELSETTNQIWKGVLELY